MTNSDLRSLYRQLNGRFFNDRCPKDLKVSFSVLRDDDGICTDDDIQISSKLKGHGTMVAIVLLHEMVHVELGYDGYVGYPKDGMHAMRFQARLWELVKAGAYDGLL